MLCARRLFTKGDVHMKIDVTELMNHRSDELHFDYSFDPAHTDIAADSLPELPDDVTIPMSGIRVTGKCFDSLGCMMFRAHIAVTYRTLCARCLDEVEEVLELDMERMILTEEVSGDSHLSADNEWDGVTEDVLIAGNSKIIPDGEILEEITLMLPQFTLCSEDCPGLCPQCGKRLKDGDCGCREEKKINPKFAVLKQLLDEQDQK